MNAAIAAVAGDERTVELVPDFKGVAGLQAHSHKPEHAWHAFAAADRAQIPAPLAEAVTRELTWRATDADQRFVEPVALSSTSPGSFRLPPTTSRWSFNLMTLRARRSAIIAHRAAPVNRESTEAGCGKLLIDRTDEEAEASPTAELVESRRLRVSKRVLLSSMVR